jgi:hypothetical protein
MPPRSRLRGRSGHARARRRGGPGRSQIHPRIRLLNRPGLVCSLEIRHRIRRSPSSQAASQDSRFRALTPPPRMLLQPGHGRRLFLFLPKPHSRALPQLPRPPVRPKRVVSRFRRPLPRRPGTGKRPRLLRLPRSLLVRHSLRVAHRLLRHRRQPRDPNLRRRRLLPNRQPLVPRGLVNQRSVSKRRLLGPNRLAAHLAPRRRRRRRTVRHLPRRKQTRQLRDHPRPPLRHSSGSARSLGLGRRRWQVPWF